MQQADSEMTNTLHSFMTKYSEIMMEKWWTIHDLKESKKFYSDQVPLRMVPCFEVLSIPKGHQPSHKEIVVEVAGARVELHTGTLWYNNKIVGQIEKADRILLFKRVVRGTNGQILKSRYFVGLVNHETKFGMVIIISSASQDVVIKNINTNEEING